MWVEGGEEGCDIFKTDKSDKPAFVMSDLTGQSLSRETMWIFKLVPVAFGYTGG